MFSSMSAKRSPAASRTQATFSSTAAGAHVASAPGPTAPAVSVPLMPTMSASRAAMPSTRWPPPPIRIGGHGRCTGFGQPVELGHLVVLALERERPVGEQALQHGEALHEAVDAHAGRVVGDAGGVVVGAHPAGADADLQPAVGEHVHGGQLLGQHDRVLVVVVEHQRADPQRGGGVGGRHHRRHGRQLVAEVVGHGEAWSSRGPRPGGPAPPTPSGSAPTTPGRRSGTGEAPSWRRPYPPGRMERDPAATVAARCQPLARALR